MRKCPKCHSLVDDERTECCGLPLPPPADPAMAAATVALSPEKVRELTGAGALPPDRKADRGPAERPPPSPAAAPVAGAPRNAAAPGDQNRAARRALLLGLLAVIPLFPIALAAFVFGVMGLGEAASLPDATGRGRAWFGIISGTLFGVLWIALTVSLVLV